MSFAFGAPCPVSISVIFISHLPAWGIEPDWNGVPLGCTSGIAGLASRKRDDGVTSKARKSGSDPYPGIGWRQEECP
ncbi:hypothetical protein NCCP2165_15410 [Halomonas sp. NCCP-2165]|nr:hypothetical protein NCCP2165_15410 [Halomonas sp. NCCP-2165]